MVSILPAERSPWDVIGRDTGRALQQVLPGAVQQGYNRGMLQKNLGDIKDIASNPQGTNLDVLLSLLQAGAGIPGSEKYIAAIAPELLRSVESNRASRIPTAADQGQLQRNREPLEPISQSRPLPEFGWDKFFPTNQGPIGGPGQAPQEATTRQKLPLLAPNEKPAAARKLVADSKEQGIVLTLPEAMKQINAYEDDKKIHNQEVDKELGQRVESQKTYGERAVDYLKGVYPKANAEVQAIFQKVGENASKKGDSEAEINRYLAKEADKFKNAIVNVQKDLSAPRLLNSIVRGLQGSYKSFDQSAKDARQNIKPLIDLGLYDTARSLLQDQGYGPEEREIVIHPLSQQAQSIVNQLPFVSKGGPWTPSRGNFDLNDIKETLIKMKQIDPNFSLVLARKALEDKGYDWRSFKDALNEMQEQGFQLEDDQKTQRGLLDHPPLDTLGKMLQGLNLIGR